eukprot:759040-Hanusia_phi.AAC.1
MVEDHLQEDVLAVDEESHGLVGVLKRRPDLQVDAGERFVTGKTPGRRERSQTAEEVGEWAGGGGGGGGEATGGEGGGGGGGAKGLHYPPASVRLVPPRRAPVKVAVDPDRRAPGAPDKDPLMVREREHRVVAPPLEQLHRRPRPEHKALSRPVEVLGLLPGKGDERSERAAPRVLDEQDRVPAARDEPEKCVHAQSVPLRTVQQLPVTLRASAG